MPTEKPRYTITLDEEMLKKIDDFRFENRFPNRTQATLELILRKDKLLSESTLQAFRNGEPVSWDNIARICEMLDCQPGNLLYYNKEAAESPCE